MNLDLRINNFAVQSFRDVADGDYIAARMASRAALVTQFLWASQQAIEKYLKCVLLLYRIPAKKVKHNLTKALERIQSSGKLSLDLTGGTKEFIHRIDESGRHRYLEVSSVAVGVELVPLDRAVWELRRYCTLDPKPREAKLVNGISAPRVRIPGGYLEKVIDNPRYPSREPLLWQNGFFGNRRRKIARIPNWFRATNAPLWLHPEILDEVRNYIYLPKDVVAAYGNHQNSLKP